MGAHSGIRGAALLMMTSRSTTGRQPSVYTRRGELGSSTTAASVAWHRMNVAIADLKISGNMLCVRGVHCSKSGLKLRSCECMATTRGQ